MAGKVFFSVTMSLDGYVAPEERMDDPDVQRWMAQWMELARIPPPTGGFEMPIPTALTDTAKEMAA